MRASISIVFVVITALVVGVYAQLADDSVNQSSGRVAIVSTAADGTSLTLDDYTNGPGYLLNSDNPSMAPGSLWSFALADVTNNATSGTQIMNFQTATGVIQTLDFNIEGLWDYTQTPTVNGNDVLVTGVDGAGNIEINLSFSEKNVPYFEITLPIGTYQDLTSFIFSGTNEWGTPASWQLLAGSVSGTPALDFRLYDISNAEVIAAFTNFTGISPTVLSSSSLSNLVSTNVIYTIQARRSVSGNNNLRLFSTKLQN